MLTQIREDIRSTQRPDWQAHLPDNFGCPEHGKLKADQWRTALEFDIPVSLIRIKSQRKPSGNIDVRLQKLVDHTLDLVMAIAWGLSRRTSACHAERYMFYMKRYLSGIKDLFPDYNLKPNHHYALHIPDILLAFGPLHGTWAFSLERLIGCLQKLNSNSKIGVNPGFLFFSWLTVCLQVKWNLLRCLCFVDGKRWYILQLLIALHQFCGRPGQPLQKTSTFMTWIQAWVSDKLLHRRIQSLSP